MTVWLRLRFAVILLQIDYFSIVKPYFLVLLYFVSTINPRFYCGALIKNFPLCPSQRQNGTSGKFTLLAWLHPSRSKFILFISIYAEIYRACVHPAQPITAQSKEQKDTCVFFCLDTKETVVVSIVKKSCKPNNTCVGTFMIFCTCVYNLPTQPFVTTITLLLFYLTIQKRYNFISRS